MKLSRNQISVSEMKYADGPIHICSVAKLMDFIFKKICNNRKKPQPKNMIYSQDSK